MTNMIIEVEDSKKKKRGRPVASKQINKVVILEIAIQEFANNGFDGARQKEIAQRAGISNSLMNYHFESKEALWREATLQMGDKLKNRIEETHKYLKDLKGLDALKAFTRQFIYFSAEHPEFYKIIFHEMCTKTDRASWLVNNILAPLHGIFDNANAVEVDGKLSFEGVPVANLSSIIIGAANTFFIHAFQMDLMYGVQPFDKKEIEQHTDIVIDLVFAKFDKGTNV